LKFSIVQKNSRTIEIYLPEKASSLAVPLHSVNRMSGSSFLHFLHRCAPAQIDHSVKICFPGIMRDDVLATIM